MLNGHRVSPVHVDEDVLLTPPGLLGQRDSSLTEHVPPSPRHTGTQSVVIPIRKMCVCVCVCVGAVKCDRKLHYCVRSSPHVRKALWDDEGADAAPPPHTPPDPPTRPLRRTDSLWPAVQVSVSKRSSADARRCSQQKTRRAKQRRRRSQ